MAAIGPQGHLMWGTDLVAIGAIADRAQIPEIGRD